MYLFVVESVASVVIHRRCLVACDRTVHVFMSDVYALVYFTVCVCYFDLWYSEIFDCFCLLQIMYATLGVCFVSGYFVLKSNSRDLQNAVLC